MMMMELHDIVKKLTGPIAPVGDSSVDEVRLKSLRATIELAEALIADITEVSQSRDSHEHSVARAGRVAWRFLDEIGVNELVDAHSAAAEIDRAGGDAPHAPAIGLAAWIRARIQVETGVR